MAFGVVSQPSNPACLSESTAASSHSFSHQPGTPLTLASCPTGPYFIPAGRAAAAATTLLPVAVIFVLVKAGKTDLESTVTMGGRLRHRAGMRRYGSAGN